MLQGALCRIKGINLEQLENYIHAYKCMFLVEYNHLLTIRLFVLLLLS